VGFHADFVTEKAKFCRRAAARQKILTQTAAKYAKKHVRYPMNTIN